MQERIRVPFVSGGDFAFFEIALNVADVLQCSGTIPSSGSFPRFAESAA